MKKPAWVKEWQGQHWAPDGDRDLLSLTVELGEAAEKLRAEVSDWHIDRAKDEWGFTNTEIVKLRVREMDTILTRYRKGPSSLTPAR